MEAAPSSPTPQIRASRRVLPATPRIAPVTKALSIADATTTRFSICGAIWFFDPSPATQDTVVLATRLEQSLGQTLDDYRHFAGQLRWARPEDVDLLPGPRTFGRPLVTYNAPTDPGVEFTYASHARHQSSLVPSSEERRSTKKVWLATDFKQDELLPSCPLAFHPDPGTFDGLPGVSAQLTVFACGGWALGVRMTHCLGDAVCLVAFVKAWAAHARVLLVSATAAAKDGGIRTKPPACLFEPALLDRHAGIVATTTNTTTAAAAAAVDDEEPHPDADKIALARALPMHRYDWWDATAPGMPAWARRDALATRVPDVAQQQEALAPGRAKLLRSPATVTTTATTPPPWATWDAGAAVDHVQVRVTASEVRGLQAVAAAAAAQLEGGGFVVSRLDALVAHFWVGINRARGLQGGRGYGGGGGGSALESDGDEEVFLNVTMGLRSRVRPALPDTFAGSPLLIGHVGGWTGPALCAAPLGAVALAVRRMMVRFTPEAVGAYLHDAAHEVSPQRIWQAFLGTRHTGVTSWVKAGVYGVDFGVGRVQYVQSRMPRLDGQLQVMDVGETGDYEVSLCLEREAMGRLLGDGKLWAWGAEGSSRLSGI